MGKVRRMSGAWRAGVCTVAVLLGGRAYAADTPTDSGQIGEITVTAQRRQQNLQDVPIVVQVISSDTMAEQGLKSTQDLGQVTPNVTIISPVGAGNQPLITIRGIGLNDFDTNNAGPNGVYVDDVYISAPSAQAFALFDLANVQILKGPQGTLYGRNTSGGAVVFTSNRPTDQFTADFSGEYGNFNTYQINGAVGGRLAENLDGRFAFSANHSDGWMKDALTGGDPYDNVNNITGRVQLQYDPSTDLKVYFESTLGWVRNHPQPYGHIGTYVPGTQSSADSVTCSAPQALAGGCVDLYGQPTAAYGTGSFARTQDLTNLASISQVRVDYKHGGLTYTSITSYQYDDKFDPEDTDSSAYDLIRATYGVKSNTFTQEFRVAKQSRNLNAVLGVYYLHESLRQNQPLEYLGSGDEFGGFGIPAGPGAFDGIAQITQDTSRQLTNSAAIFGQVDYTLGQVTLTAGGRYTRERKAFSYFTETAYQEGGMGNYGPYQGQYSSYNSLTDGAATWRAAVSYKPVEHLQIYGSISTGFKSGGFNGSFLSNDPAQLALQLQPIKHEYVTAYEIGEKASLFDRRLVVNAALFYNQYRNEQIFATVTEVLSSAAGDLPTSVQLLTNARKAHTEGAEFQVTAMPVHGLMLDLQPAFLRTRLDDADLPFSGLSINGNELANAPRFSFAGTLAYTLDLPSGNSVKLSWDANYRSHTWFDATNDPYIQQNGYWLHNANIDLKSSGKWTLGLFVRNVFDKQYFLTSTDLSATFGFLEPVEGAPRTYGVRFGYHY
jgi:iron complex outermembrane recepter protein